MIRTTVDKEASAEHSQKKGVEYLVLRLNDSKIFEDLQITELGQELFEYVDHYPQSNVCVDFENVDFCYSSSFLGELMTADRKLRDSNRNPLGVRNVSPEIYKVFVITGLDRRFEMDEASKMAYESSRGREDTTLTPEYVI